MKYSETIADKLTKDGWRCGCISSTGPDGQQFWIVAAQRDGKRFIVRGEFDVVEVAQ